MSVSRGWLGAAATLTVLLCASAGAQAQSARRVVVILGPERATELAEAIRLELAARGLEMLVTGPSSEATAPLARAAAAQEAARTVGAEATLWIEAAAVGGGASVRAVGVGDDLVRHAPLPAPLATVEARVLALVGASLLDEISAGHDASEDDPITVRVAVAIDAPGRTVSVSTGTPPVALATAPTTAAVVPAPPPVPIAPPRAEAVVRASMAATPAPAPAVDRATDTGDLPLLPRDGWNLEAGLMFAGVAGGAQATLSHYLNDAWRLGPTVSAVLVWADDLSPAFTLGGTLLRAGRARSGRFDFGVHAGLVAVVSNSSSSTFAAEPGAGVTGPSDTYVAGALYGWTAEALFGWGWELSRSLALDLRFALGTAQVDGGELVPVAWASMAVELPL